MGKIRVAIAGVGNCASALCQGIEMYKNIPAEEAIGLMHYNLGGYLPGDIEIVAAFDVDRRKVGKKLKDALLSPPNCTKIFHELPDFDVEVMMGPVLDGVAEHMGGYPENSTFVVADKEPVDVEKVLKETGADILLNYVPVGSEEAARYYAQCCLNTGVSFINCMPVFIVSDKEWAKKFEEKGIPVVGDDIKSQVGATIVHRTLARLFSDRGVKLERTYQLNFGGNTDFLNMLERSRLRSKKISKTEAVQASLDERLPEEDIHIGPSDYVPWLKDNKICYIRMEGLGFGKVPITIELKLSVEDSPNSAGVAIDAIRYCKLARDRGDKGPLYPMCAYTMKHPPKQMREEEARRQIEEYINA